MSFQAMTWAVKQELPAMQKIVLLMMANRANPETGACFPSVKTLSKECGMAIRSITNQIMILKDTGLISVVNQFERDGRQTSNSYVLNFDKVIKFRDIAEDDTEQANDTSEPIFSPPARDADTGVQQIVAGGAADAYKTEKLNTNNKTENLSTPRACVAEFVPPLAQDVFNYWAAMCLMMSMDDAEAFIDYWSSTGWMVGNTRITDWYGKARSWVRNKKRFNSQDAARKPARSSSSKQKPDFHNPPKYSLDDDFGDSSAIDSFAVPVPAFMQIGGVQ
jgi:hypothetical protein